MSEERTMSVRIGPYGTRVAAEREVMELRRDSVFENRTAMFALPKSMGVEARIGRADIVQLEEGQYRKQFAIELDIVCSGDNVARWIQVTQGKLRIFTV